MRRTASVVSLIAMLAASAALAQEVPYSRTLDEQLMRIKQGKSPIPQAHETKANAPAAAPQAPAARSNERKPFPPAPAGTNEWPAEPQGDSQPAPAPSAGGDAQAAPAAPSAGMVYRDRKGEVINSVGGDAIPALPLDIMQVGEVKFITGGIGDEEMAQLKFVEHDYNMRALVASTSGEYMGGLVMRVLDASGAEVLSADDAGPYLYALLKPGKYTLEVTSAQDVKKSAGFTVPASGFVKPVVRF